MAIFFLTLFRLAFTFAVLAFAAWMAVWHVPTLIDNPENFWAWFWLLFGLGAVVGNYAYQAEVES